MSVEPCIDADTAASYAAGSLSAAEITALERHIDGCSSCRVLVSMVARSGASSQAETVGGRASNTVVMPKGTKVGRFEVIEPLDAGGMGMIYVALDPKLDRRVALKAVRDQRADPAALLREAQLMAQLSHPNVVPVHEVVEAQGQVFIAMELVLGQSLKPWLDARTRSWREIVDAFLLAGSGLAAAHQAGIVHGDVKPGNVLVGDDGRVRVTDFGLARLSSDAHEEGLVRGTPAYLAPEQLDGKPPDAFADQYAFCVSLHEALHGALPGKPPARRSNAPRAVGRVIARGLEREPSRRFPSMRALLDALRSARSTRTRWLVLGGAATATLIAIAYLSGARKAENAQCTELAAQLTSPWDDSARAAVKTVFDHNALPFGAEAFARLSSRLDAWKASLDTTRQRACATHLFGRTAPPDVLRTQLTCLADGVRDVRALLGLMQDADPAMITNADAFTERLASPARCAASTPTPAPAPQGTRVEELRDLIARTRMLLVAGRIKELQPLAKQADQLATDLGDPALRASARLVLGNSLARSGDYDGAEAALREAIRLADAAQADRLRAQAWVTLVQTQFWRGRSEKLLELRDAAMGACERIGDDGLATEVMLMEGAALSQLGKLKQAQGVYEEVVKRRTRLFGERDRQTSAALSALGNALAMQGDLEGGIAAHRRAVEIDEAAEGAAHPNVGISHGNLGDDYLYGLHTADAVRELEKAESILETAHGLKQRDTVNSLTDLGWAYLYAGDAEKALATFDKADVAWDAVNAKHPVHGMCLLGRQAALERLGRPGSIDELERALSLAGGMPPFEKGRAQLALGEALVATDPTRARTLVKDSLTGLSSTTLPLIAQKKSEAQTWLDAHGEKK